MTWAERVGDVATNVALVLINLGRIFTLIVRSAAIAIDDLVTSLAERSETGIRPVEAPGTTWVARITAVAWGVAAVALRTLSIATVFVRQVAVTLDEFLRVLAEGEGGAGPPTTL